MFIIYTSIISLIFILLVTIHSQNIHRLWEIMKKILIIFYYEGKSSTICIESTVIKDERNIVRKTTKNSR